MLSNHVAQWLENNPLSPTHVDCATAVMLKILDGKCKMKIDEKKLMAVLYQQTKHQPGNLLGNDIHQLIKKTGNTPDEEMSNHIYEKRLLAETMISRPVMKEFKALIRKTGLLDISKEPELEIPQ